MTGRRNASPKKAKAKTTLDMTLGPDMAQVWLGVMQDGARLMSERQRRASHLQAAFLGAKSPGDMMDAQAALMQAVLEDYVSGTAWASNAITQVLGMGKDLPSGPAKRRYDDLPV